MATGSSTRDSSEIGQTTAKKPRRLVTAQELLARYNYNIGMLAFLYWCE